MIVRASIVVQLDILLKFVGGLGFNCTKYVAMAEILANDPAISVTLGAHQSIGLKVNFLTRKLILMMMYHMSYFTLKSRDHRGGPVAHFNFFCRATKTLTENNDSYLLSFCILCWLAVYRSSFNDKIHSKENKQHDESSISCIICGMSIRSLY